MGLALGPVRPAAESVPATGHDRATAPGRAPALDGLRGLALVAVLAYHSAPAVVPGGFLGVESFFVLSGFLLTSLLLIEHQRNGRIDGRAYAERRARRIGPALAALLAALVVLAPVLAPDDAHRLAGDVGTSLIGVTNWHLVADASSYFDQAGRPSFVRHLWSVAVEIQFYVICPFLVAWLYRRRRGVAMAALAVGITGSALAMTLLYQSGDPSRAYYGTEARVGALLSGALLAVALAGRGVRPLTGAAARRAMVALGPLSLGALTVLFVFADDRARWAYPGVFVATQALTATLIVATTQAGAVSRLLGSHGLRWLGLRSFGIYLWHWPAVVLLRPGIDVEWPPVVTGALGVAVAVALGALSFAVVERPWMRRRRPDVGGSRRPQTSRRAWAVVAVAVATGLGAMVARLPTADPVAETLRAGESILAAQPGPTLLAKTVPSVGPPPPGRAPAPPGPDPGAPGAGPEAAPATTASTAAPGRVPAGVTIRAIGDSVMVSAAGALQDRLGASGYIDAELSRQFSDGIAVARDIVTQGGASVVVVHLGNNGPVQARDVDALVNELSGIPAVLLVNVRVDSPWRASVNQTLAEAAERYPSATLVDWYGASEGHADWFQSDGTHFRTTSGPGANAFADLIVASIPAPAPPSTAAPPPPTAPPPTAAPVSTTTTTSTTTSTTEPSAGPTPTTASTTASAP